MHGNRFLSFEQNCSEKHNPKNLKKSVDNRGKRTKSPKNLIITFQRYRAIYNCIRMADLQDFAPRSVGALDTVSKHTCKHLHTALISVQKESRRLKAIVWQLSIFKTTLHGDGCCHREARLRWPQKDNIR